MSATSEDATPTAQARLSSERLSRAEVTDRRWAPPAGFPGWAREIAELYVSASRCLFILHGNVHDWYDGRPLPAAGEAVVDGGSLPGTTFCDLTEFLSQQLFGSWDLVVSYDLGRGLGVEAGADGARHQQMMRDLAAVIGSPTTWPRDPDQVLGLLDKLIQRHLLQDPSQPRKRLAILFPFAQYLVPAGENAMLARTQASRLVRLVAWAQNPYIKRTNMAFCLIADALGEISDELVHSAHVAAVEVPLPDEGTRRRFVHQHLSVGENAAPPTAPADTLVESMTQISNGLNLVNLQSVVSRLSGAELDVQQFRKLKKGLIERQCQDLVTFVEPQQTLDLVVGHTAAIERLQQDAQWIVQGRLELAPMGYLICGPVGTGKSFLAECYAGSIGIPCVVLRNFRSKYVGETEGNLQRILTVLRSLGPVVVVIDEADAALGHREMEGDSGTSNRVFSMIASQMGDTRYRGRIVWMLLTSRPELLPIDLKRQGRAEVHIPLFYPADAAEIREMFRVLARKNKIPLEAEAIPDVDPQRQLSGADIESVLLGARRGALVRGASSVAREDLQHALQAFIPSAQGVEKTLQEYAAVLECTDRQFLPERWQRWVDQPEGRERLQTKMFELRQLIGREG